MTEFFTNFIIINTISRSGPLASIFWLDEELESRLRLDAIVTIVDLKHLESALDDPQKADGQFCNEAELQLAYADCVLLNKRGKYYYYFFPIMTRLLSLLTSKLYSFPSSKRSGRGGRRRAHRGARAGD